jgi:hypothetical protein
MTGAGGPGGRQGGVGQLMAGQCEKVGIDLSGCAHG